MTRALSRVRHDEVVRMVKAVQRCGLNVGEVVFDGARVRVIIGNSGEVPPPSIDNAAQPENFDTLEEYTAWRERERARGG